MRSPSASHSPRAPRPATLAALALLTLAALALRALLLKAGNSDVHLFRDWLQALRDGGGLHALGDEIGNYTPVILYLLLIGDHVLVGAPDIVVIKYAAIVADVVGAAFAYRIVRLRYADGLQPVLAFGIVLLAPTVVLNSAYWGQTDMIWTAAIVAALYFFLRERSLVALVFVGVAFAFKQQAEFILPFLVLLALKRTFPWRYFLVLPAVYAVAVLPALLAGRPAWDLATIYVSQAATYSQLTLNAPTLYQWLPETQADVLGPVGAVVGVLVLAVLVAIGARWIDELTPTLLLALATASVLVTPFVLPRIHERYFFAADVLTIILAFYVPRLAVVAAIVQFVSLASYWPFLFDHELVAGELLALLELAAIAMLLGWIVSDVRGAARVEHDPYPAADGG